MHDPSVIDINCAGFAILRDADCNCDTRQAAHLNQIDQIDAIEGAGKPIVILPFFQQLIPNSNTAAGIAHTGMHVSLC